MQPVIVVGGGSSGLMAANLLKKKGVFISGFEKSGHLGGNNGWMAYERFLTPQALESLREAGLGSCWEFVEATAVERKKGAWILSEVALRPIVQSYIERGFYWDQENSMDIVHRLANSEASSFQLNKQVTEVLHQERRIIFSDESSIEFEKMIWCAGLQRLSKCLRPANQKFVKAIKDLPEAACAFAVEFFAKESFFPTQNSVVFVFRHKDEKLVALGTESTTKNGIRTLWTVFLERERAEDKEEVAKYVRTFKRELFKEFPESSNKLKEGKISFFPEISDEGFVTFSSLEVLPGIFCVGSEVVPQSLLETKLGNWDRIVLSCQNLCSFF